MSKRTELAFSYDQRMHPVSAKCRLCGEGMPQPQADLGSPAEIVFWLAQRFIEHKKEKHPAAAVSAD